jgi:hypothetical protein
MTAFAVIFVILAAIPTSYTGDSERRRRFADEDCRNGTGTRTPGFNITPSRLNRNNSYSDTPLVENVRRQI